MSVLANIPVCNCMCLSVTARECLSASVLESEYV